MSKTILAFGDSNTHGTPPMHSSDHHPRLPRRWPVVMQELLDCQLIEDGLPGRTACQVIATSEDAHLDGLLGLRMALLSHGPIDHLLIMLGTNDLQCRFGKSEEAVMAGLSALLKLAHDPEAQARHGGYDVTLICPPPVEEVGTFAREFYGARPKATALAGLLSPLAAAWSAGFIDAGQVIRVSPIDGVHFDAASHDTLGRAIASELSPAA